MAPVFAPVGLVTDWERAGAHARPQAWQAVMGRLDVVLLHHLPALLERITSQECAQILASPYAALFWHHLRGRLMGSLPSNRHATEVGSLLATAPWAHGGLHAADGTELLPYLVRKGADAAACTLLERQPQAAGHLRPSSLLEGTTPCTARLAMGCPRTGEGHRLFSPAQVAACAHPAIGWPDSMTGLLALLWTRGLRPTGTARPVAATAGWQQGWGKIEAVSSHRRLAFLAAIGCPYSARPDPTAIRALFDAPNTP